MYLLFRYHHMAPSLYYGMGHGERTVIRAFMHYEVQERNEEIEHLKQRGSS
jgi:hypothetical protein